MRIKTKVATGLSLPLELKEKIDKERGDVSYSRFLLRILEKYYLDADKGEEEDLQN
jgi:hypothetical protein